MIPFVEITFDYWKRIYDRLPLEKQKEIDLSMDAYILASGYLVEAPIIKREK